MIITSHAKKRISERYGEAQLWPGGLYEALRAYKKTDNSIVDFIIYDGKPVFFAVCENDDKVVKTVFHPVDIMIENYREIQKENNILKGKNKKIYRVNQNLKKRLKNRDNKMKRLYHG